MPIRSEVTNGFWVGIGFAAAFLVWSFMQLLLHRAEGH